jgi:hypothetical protein
MTIRHRAWLAWRSPPRPQGPFPAPKTQPAPDIDTHPQDRFRTATSSCAAARGQAARSLSVSRLPNHRDIAYNKLPILRSVGERPTRLEPRSDPPDMEVRWISGGDGLVCGMVQAVLAGLDHVITLMW